jgi:hypothetical protein
MAYNQSADVVKEVKYLNKDFASLRNQLIEFTKIYYPNTYNDFNEASPGMMFIEMASYVGDVLSYYIDEQFKESLLAYAEERKTVFEMAQGYGYRPRLSSPSVGKLDVFQTVPSSGSGESVAPDMRYALNLLEGLVVKSTTGTEYRSVDNCNFKSSGSFDQTDVTIFEVDNGGTPSKYLLKKSIQVKSGETSTETFDFGSAVKYNKVTLSNPNVIEILSVTDSDGNIWKEVPFLAQDTVFEEVENTSTNDPELFQFNETAPYLLKLLKTPYRFTTFIRPDGRSEMRFGAGVSDNPDEEIIPSPGNVNADILTGGATRLDSSFDPTNFLNTRTYGLAPSNTTLTVQYSYGGSINDNAAAGSIINFGNVVYGEVPQSLNASLVQESKNSVAVINPEPTSGGGGPETIQEVKNNALKYFQSQNRCVTKEDYIIRVYSLPPKYGNVAKVYIVQDTQLEGGMQTQVSPGVFSIDPSLINEDDIPSGPSTPPIETANPLALNMYVLGYTPSKQIVTVNQAVKENVKTYLGQYRLITDAVNIKDAWVINIGVKFTIITKSGYNKQEVILRCINKVKQFFAIDRWQINQPIVLVDLAQQISFAEGVAAVVPPEANNPNSLPVVVYNKYKQVDGYSGNIFNIQSSTKNGVIYPSVDPAIFELKFPNQDIEGRVKGDSTGGES